MGNNIKGRFADQDSYVLSQLLQTTTSNAADLNVIVQESDYLHATSAYFQPQGLTSTTITNVPTVTQVAQQTTTTGVADGTITPDGEPVERQCPEVNQFVYIRGDNGLLSAVRAGTIVTGQFLYNPISEQYEEITHAEVVPSELWEAITSEQCKFTGSPTTPIIQSMDDTVGLALKACHIGTKALTLHDWVLETTEIRTIVKRKARGYVNHLTTAGPGHIYLAGARADKTICIHNVKPSNANEFA